MGETIRIARCRRCNEAYIKVSFSVCDNCLDDEDADYQRISDTLAENPNKNVETVAYLADVTPSCVLRMLDRGLIANEQVDNDVRCGKCGEPALSVAQKLCQSCLIKLDQKFFSEINEAKRTQDAQNQDQSVHDTIDRKRQSIQKKERPIITA
jgi:ribosomal protein L37E